MLPFEPELTMGILIGIVLGSTNILTVSIILSHKHGISFHLFVSSVSFINVILVILQIFHLIG